MRGAYIVAQGDLTLGEITPATVQAATVTITAHATDAADLAQLMAMIRPRPHTVRADPSERRAAPRRGLEA